MGRFVPHFGVHCTDTNFHHLCEYKLNKYLIICNSFQVSEIRFGSGSQMSERLLCENLTDLQQNFVFAPHISSKVSLEAADALGLDHIDQRLSCIRILVLSKFANKVPIFGVSKAITRLALDRKGW